MRTHLMPKRRKLFLQNENTYNTLKQEDPSIIGCVAPSLTNQESLPNSCCCCYRVPLCLPATLKPCARCDQFMCIVCTRTCEGGSLSSSSDTSVPTQYSLPLNKHTVTRKIRPMRKAATLRSTPSQAGRRRQRVEEENIEYPWQESTHYTILGCKRIVCRKCTIEDPVSQATTCQDCHNIANLSKDEGLPNESAMDEACE
ncbi:hypothetical protein QCA50_001066 [Cerrena zonata]|uniref:Uncharacterized protein n=1 Tax=Cerrena zonata TaxID=2478898 RepID=A0AAW0GXU5_9APHY